MKNRGVFWIIFLTVACGGFLPLRASVLDTIGVTLLRTVDPSLTGTNSRVALIEAAGTNNDWEVNPAAAGQPVSLFTWYSYAGSSPSFPNTLGNESGHADGTGNNFFGVTDGVAPGVSHVDNYFADYFYDTMTVALPLPSAIANQSFIITDEVQTDVDSKYDDYVALHGTLFCSSVGYTPPYPPSTAYNVISVGAYGAAPGISGTGPTADNGRSKPDITAPAEYTSFSAPLVSGAAAILLEAGGRNDGGPGTSANATNLRTLKALLLNGAVKPSNWTHTATAPLDPNYGAGIVNIFNSWKQLSGGQQAPIDSSSVVPGEPHPPTGNGNNLASRVGWDFRTISNNTTNDTVNHYYFNLPRSTGDFFTVTATLVWNRQLAQTNINGLDLFLYDTATSNLVAASVSEVDNVEHVYLPKLAAGRYDLQVLKSGVKSRVTTSEDYALAFEFFAMPLAIMPLGTNAVISWPIAPTGFALESTTNLTPPIAWTAVTNSVGISNGINRVTVNASSGVNYFRLRR